MKTKCQIKYYGIIGDIIGMDAEEAEFNGHIPTLNHLKGTLEKGFPDMKEVDYLFAVNQTLVSDLTTRLKNNDEIALLPAFSGG